MNSEYGNEFIKKSEKDLPQIITVNKNDYKLFAQALLSGSLIIRYGEHDGKYYNWENKSLELTYTIVDTIPEKGTEVSDKVIYKKSVDDIISDCLLKIRDWKDELEKVTDEPKIIEKKSKNSDFINGDDFMSELTQLLNKYSVENVSDTPDYILSEYLIRCLDNYNKIVNKREKWYGRL